MLVRYFNSCRDENFQYFCDVCIFKSEGKTASNYQPTSLLSNFDRIFKKLLHCVMKDFTLQCVFPEAHSSEHTILDFVETLRNNMDEHYFFVWCFHWFKKGFLHFQSQNKTNCGFRGIINVYLQSYLTIRRQPT